MQHPNSNSNVNVANNNPSLKEPKQQPKNVEVVSNNNRSQQDNIEIIPVLSLIDNTTLRQH